MTTRVKLRVNDRTSAKLQVVDPSPVHFKMTDGGVVLFTSSEYSRMVTTDLPEFEGPYGIIPTRAAQAIPTAAHSMRRDVEIGGIPYAAVSNPSGGMTATIG